MPRCQHIFAEKTIFFVCRDVLAFISAGWDWPAVSPLFLLFLQMRVVPVARQPQALTDIIFGFITKQRAGAGDVRQRMTHVPGPEVPMDGLGFRGLGLMADDLLADKLEKLVERGPLSEGYIIDEVPGVFRGMGRQQVRLHHVVDVAEIAGRLAVSVDMDGIALRQCGEPLGDHRRVRAVRVLTLAEHVEVAQADGLEAITARENLGVEFIDILRHGVGRERLADAVFLFGQVGLVAVGGARSRIDKALYSAVTGRYEHVEEPVDVAAVGHDRVFDGAGH